MVLYGTYPFVQFSSTVLAVKTPKILVIFRLFVGREEWEKECLNAVQKPQIQKITLSRLLSRKLASSQSDPPSSTWNDI